VWLDSEQQLVTVRAATLMAKLMQEDVFILDDLTLTSSPDKQNLQRVLEVVRCPDKEEEP
jgi:hypothetical protein